MNDAPNPAFAWERAAIVGVPFARYREIDEAHPGSLSEAAMATWGGRLRARVWVALGAPSADVRDVTIAALAPRAKLIRDVLSTLPTSAAWFAATGVTILSVEGCDGWCWRPPTLRALPEDAPQLVWISPTIADDRLAFVVAHEMAHSWLASYGAPPTPSRDEDGGKLLAQRVESRAEVEAVLRDDMIEEYRADDLARAWGVHVPHVNRRPQLARRLGL